MITNTVFYLDSGASYHMTNDRSTITNLTRLAKPAVVKTITGETINVEFSGKVTLIPMYYCKMMLEFSDVLYHPKLSASVISFGRLAEKFKVIDKDPYLWFVDPTTNRFIASVKRDAKYVYKLGYALDAAFYPFSFAYATTYPISSMNECIAAYASSNPKVTVELLHARMGHTGISTLKKMWKEGAFPEASLTEEDFDKAMENTCRECALGKQKQMPYPPSDTGPRPVLHTDVCYVKIGSDKRLMVTAVWEPCEYSFITLVNKKSKATNHIKEVIAKIETQTGEKVKFIRSDRGREYINYALGDYFLANGIHHEQSIIKTPQQNGKAERFNGVLLDLARCLLAEANSSPDWLWIYAMHTANYLRNIRMCSKSFIPYTCFWGRAPDYSMLKVFGCKAYPLLHPTDRENKLSPVSEEGMFVGYCENSKGYELVVQDEDGQYYTIERRNVVFDEKQKGVAACFPSSRPKSGGGAGGNVGVSLLPDDGIGAGDGTGGEILSGENETGAGGKAGGSMQSGGEAGAGGEAGGSILSGGEAGAGGEAGGSHPVNSQLKRVAPDFGGDPPRGRSGRELKRNKMYDKDYYTYMAKIDDDTLEVACLYAPDTEGVDPLDPKSVKEALASPQAPKWIEALDSEYSALVANNTYQIVPRPNDRHVLPTKFVLKVKRNSIGQLEKYKARWVCQGFRQVPGIDYFEISSPVAKLSTARTLLAVSAKLGWDIQQLDINNAFLLGELEEEIYVEQPEGYEVKDRRTHVCLLKKSLYGLKQAPLVWYKTVSKCLDEIGFTLSISDPSTFYVKNKSDKVFAVIYVDDFLLAGPSKAFNDKIKNAILSTFQGKDLQNRETFLGMNVHRDIGKGTIKISSPAHIDKLVSTYRLTDARVADTPITKDLPLTKDNGSPPIDPLKVPYRQLVGSLLYISMTTRPDIAYAVSILSRFMSCPTDFHWKTAKRVVCYLKGTRDYGLVFGNSLNKCTLDMESYVDASHADDLDLGLSTYGYAFILNGATVGWTSRKEAHVAQSTSEAEIVALSLAVTEGMWFQKLLHDCDLPIHITMWVDNANALSTAKRDGKRYPNRTKYIRIHTMRVLEQRDFDNTMSFEYVPTATQRADIFTKPLDRVKFEQLRTALGVCV